MRWERSPAAILTAVALMSSMGRMARVESHQPPVSPNTNTRPPMPESDQAKWWSSANSITME